jgi:hypothetical protein
MDQDRGKWPARLNTGNETSGTITYREFVE